MKKLKNRKIRILSIIAVVVSSFLLISNVKAESMIVGDYVDKIYLKKVKGDTKKYLRSQWIYRASDNKFVYCLEPWVIIDESQEYQETIDFNDISKTTLDRVKLIAYYGYGYNNHQNDYWYTVTQMLIWKEIDKDADFYFTDRLNGDRINLYENEMNEILNLVNNHYKLPSFANNSYKFSIGKDYQLNDENNVLNLFEIESNDNIIKNNNLLTIKSTEAKNISINLVKQTNKYKNIPLIYVSGNSQNVMAVGNYESVKTSLNIEFVSGSIKLIKKDKDGVINKNVSLQNAEYILYDEAKNIVGRFVTDANGMSEIKNLPIGKYYIKEAKSSYGYELDLKEYMVNLDINNLNENLIVYEKQKEKVVKINKVYINKDTNQEINEDGVIFEIYKQGESNVYKTLKTDKQGTFKISLPYGTYIFKQKNSKNGYKKVDDFTIVIDETTSETVNKKLIDYPELTIKVPETFADRKNNVYINLFIIYGIFSLVLKRWKTI